MSLAKPLFTDDAGKLLLRVPTGGLLLFHGLHKVLYGHDFIRLLLQNHGLPAFLSYGVPVGEVLAPVMILLGLFARVASLFVAFTMLMSVYLFFGVTAFKLDAYGGLNCQLNLFFLFAALAIFFLGSGKYSFKIGNGRWN